MGGKRNKSEKGKYCVISLIYGIQKTWQTKNITKKQQTQKDTENELTVAPAGQGRGGNMGVPD